MRLKPIPRPFPFDSHHRRKPYKSINRYTHPLNSMTRFLKRVDTASVRSYENHLYFPIFAMDVVNNGLEFLLAVASTD